MTLPGERGETGLRAGRIEQEKRLFSPRNEGRSQARVDVNAGKCDWGG